ncbi:hypothetical protein ACWXWU_19805 [Shewanella sp. A14]
MIFKKIFTFFIVFLLMACSPNYNEKLITEPEMISEVRNLTASVKRYNVKEVSYYSKEVIILNGIVINPINKTFGKSPDGGLMMTYSDKAADNSFTSWNQVFAETSPVTSLSNEKLNELLADMANIGVTDIFNDSDYNIIRIQWGNSVMLGINGLIFGNEKDAVAFQQDAKFDVFKKISDEVYFFQLL